MKKLKVLAVCLYAIILFGFFPMLAQDAGDQRIDMVDLKMDLAETKLELLDSRIRLWEEKPALLEIQLRNIERSIEQLSFSPEQFNNKFLLLDSLLEKQQSLMAEQREIMTSLPIKANNGESYNEPDYFAETILMPSDKYVISMYPVKLFEGTLQLSIERVLNRGNSIELSAMATYATKEGLANYYISNQMLEYFNADLAEYTSYESENITGFGGSFAWRNYLFPRTNPDYSAPNGTYVAPMVMSRRLILSGFDQVNNELDGKTEVVEVVQYLNVFSGGFLVGWQFVLFKAITADIYVGGVIRLSKYDGDARFTKYKQLQNIDFSGVMPSFGIKIGFVK